MKRKFLYVLLKHKEDGRILCEDGMRRTHADPYSFKTYKRVGNALRCNPDYSAHHVYEGDRVDSYGRVSFEEVHYLVITETDVRECRKLSNGHYQHILNPNWVWDGEDPRIKRIKCVGNESIMR